MQRRTYTCPTWCGPPVTTLPSSNFTDWGIVQRLRLHPHIHVQHHQLHIQRHHSSLIHHTNTVPNTTLTPHYVPQQLLNSSSLLSRQQIVYTLLYVYVGSQTPDPIKSDTPYVNSAQTDDGTCIWDTVTYATPHHCVYHTNRYY